MTTQTKATLRHPLAARGVVLRDVGNLSEWLSLWETMWSKDPIHLEYAEGLLHNLFSPTRTLSELRKAFRICAQLADGHNCERYFLAEGEVLNDPEMPHNNRRYLAQRAWRELCNNMLTRNVEKSNYVLAQLVAFNEGLEPNTVAEDMLTLFHPAPPYMLSPRDRNFQVHTKEDLKYLETFKSFLRELWFIHEPTRIPKYIRELRVRSIPHLVGLKLAPELMADMPQCSLEEENWPYKEMLEYITDRLAFGTVGLLSRQLANGSELAALYVQLNARWKLRQK